MTATNHALTGAIVALTVREPAAAIVLAFLTHFFLDSLPHFGIKEEDIFHRNHNPTFYRMISIDILLLILVGLWLGFSSHHISNWVMLGSAAAAYSPDIAWLWMFLQGAFTGKFKPGGWFVKLHKKLQHEYPWGMAVELVWFVAAVVVIAVIE